MPIRFACVHCGQKLRVSSRRAGQEERCPKCKQRLTIPQAAAEPTAEQAAEELEEARDPYAQFVVYDDPEWVYEDEASGVAARAAAAAGEDRVAVPRRVLYVQGVLLGAVALVSLSIGILIGGRRADPPVPLAAGPCELSGQVSFRASDGRTLPDEGAVVMAVPVDRRPGTNERLAIEGLPPGDPLPNDNNPSLRTIRQLGGNYTRVDHQGAYRLRLPATGRFFLLVLSNNARRAPDVELDKQQLAQMGRYFQRVVELLNDRRYEWRETAIRGDESLDVKF